MHSSAIVCNNRKGCGLQVVLCPFQKVSGRMSMTFCWHTNGAGLQIGKVLAFDIRGTSPGPLSEMTMDTCQPVHSLVALDRAAVEPGGPSVIAANAAQISEWTSLEVLPLPSSQVSPSGADFTFDLILGVPLGRMFPCMSAI